MATILIAEDEQELRDVYKDILTGAGFQVDTAADGKEAVTKVLANAYDVLLLDVMMPILDGLGVLTKLTQEGPKPTHMPAIVMWSNLSHEPAVAQAMQMGAKEYLIKANITPDQLIAVVQKYAGIAAIPQQHPSMQSPNVVSMTSAPMAPAPSPTQQPSPIQQVVQPAPQQVDPYAAAVPGAQQYPAQQQYTQPQPAPAPYPAQAPQQQYAPPVAPQQYQPQPPMASPAPQYQPTAPQSYPQTQPPQYQYPPQRDQGIKYAPPSPAQPPTQQ